MLCAEPITHIPSDSPLPEVRIENPLARADWDGWVSAAPGAMFFHGVAWARVLESTHRFRPIYFTVEQEKRLASLMPVMEVNSRINGRRGVSLPFTDHCEPLGFSEISSKAVIQQVLQHGRTRGWKYFECRGGKPFGDVAPSTTYLGHKLNLTSNTKILFNRIHDAVRRAIRKAERSGVSIEISTSCQAVRDFFVLHCRTRRRHGLPPQPWSFFMNIHNHVLSQNQGMIATATCRGQPVASAVFFHLGHEALFKFGASDPSFQQFRPNDLVMWEAIKWYASLGKTCLDFGRTSLEGEGLRRYKLGWGTEERRIQYYKYDFRKGDFVTAKDESLGWYNRLFRVLPIPVSRAIGALLYKHTA